MYYSVDEKTRQRSNLEQCHVDDSYPASERAIFLGFDFRSLRRSEWLFFRVFFFEGWCSD